MALRAPEPEDAIALKAILAEPSVRRWWRDEDPAELVTEDDAWIVEIDGEVAGYVMATEETEPDYRHVALDLFLASAHHGRGLGPEVLREVMAGFEAQGHHRFTIDPNVNNVAAIRAYEKAGFERVGILRRQERQLDGTWEDALLMDRVVEVPPTP